MEVSSGYIERYSESTERTNRTEVGRRTRGTLRALQFALCASISALTEVRVRCGNTPKSEVSPRMATRSRATTMES